MAALTKREHRSLGDIHSFASQIVNGERIFSGAFLAAGAPHHGTAANRGRIYPFEDEAGAIPLGLAVSGGGSNADQGKDDLTGNTSATEGIPKFTHLLGDFVTIVDVTGAASVADQFKPVYLTSDNDVTLTRPTLGVQRGIVLEYRSGTSCEVLFFGVSSMMAIMLGGAGRGVLSCMIGVGLAANGDLATGIVAPHAGTITDVYAICAIGPTDADVDIDANLEIDGTNVTGGVVELVTADVAGTKKAGTAVTAANTFQQGSLIDVEGTVNTAGTVTDPGLYTLFIEYDRQFGL